MFEQVYEPVANNLALSALVALIPIALLFVLLVVFSVPAQCSSLAALGVAFVVTMVAYGMPVGLAVNLAIYGAAFGLFPIAWIVVNAIFVYNVIVEAGYFETVRNSMATLSSDRRIQVLIIAFVFGALLEAIAGFGTPVRSPPPSWWGWASRPTPRRWRF